MQNLYWLHPDTHRVSETPTGLLTLQGDDIEVQIELFENGLIVPVTEVATFLNRAHQLIVYFASIWVVPEQSYEPEFEPEHIEPLAEPDPEPEN